MLIPKTLHYVWFGNDKPDDVIKNIESWKTNLGPGWNIKEWNQDNFDVQMHPFTRYHFRKKNWAFLSDYIRGYALYNEGGFYFDTDVELLKPLDQFLKNEMVFSKNWKISLTASTMGSIKKTKILKNYLESYNSFFVKVTQPFVMSSQIITAAVYSEIKYTLKKETELISNILLLDEKVLQVNVDEKSSISIHHHYDDWKGKNNGDNNVLFYERKLENAEKPLTQDNILKFKKEYRRKKRFIKNKWT